MSIKTIVVPTDFSDHAARAFATALEFAKVFGATVRLIHVYDVPDMDTVYEVTFPEGVVEGIRTAAIAKLDALKEQAKAEGVEASTHLEFGSPSQIIVQHAKDSKADLIVLGSRGHGILNHLLLGNVAERTLRTAPCPVLTIGKHASTGD